MAAFHHIVTCGRYIATYGNMQSPELMHQQSALVGNQGTVISARDKRSQCLCENRVASEATLLSIAVMACEEGQAWDKGVYYSLYGQREECMYIYEWDYRPWPTLGPHGRNNLQFCHQELPTDSYMLVHNDLQCADHRLRQE